MLYYIQRWKVINALYHLARKRDQVVWVPEYDLCAWISGTDLKKPNGRDNFFQFLKYHFWYLIYEVDTHNRLYTKIRNVICQCESDHIGWIERTSRSNGEISDSLALTAKGEENYAVSSLIGLVLGNYYVKWIATGLIAWFLFSRFNITISG